MTFDWQDIAALSLAGGASIYIAYAVWGFVARKRRGCGTGSCAKCPGDAAKAPEGFVSLEQLSQRRRE